MKQTREPGRRGVSKGEYVRPQSKTMGIMRVGLGVGAAAVLWKATRRKGAAARDHERAGVGPTQTLEQEQKPVFDEETIEETTQKTATGKRIVSRGEYLWLQSRTVGVRLLIFGIGAAILLCAFIMGFVPLLLMYFGIIAPLDEPGYGLCRWAVTLGCIVAISAATVVLMCKLCDWWDRLLGFEGTRNAIAIHDVDAIALPAAESLVRASSEPAQAQKNALLRAVIEQTQKKQETELLRASSEG